MVLYQSGEIHSTKKSELGISYRMRDDFTHLLFEPPLCLRENQWTSLTSI